MDNGMFKRMCEEAVDEVASGDKSWREINPNVMLLACFHLLSNHLAHKLGRPLWCFAGCVCAAVITYIVNMIFGHIF